MNRKQFMRAAEAAFRRANPGVDITIHGWDKVHWVRYPTGLEGWRGDFVAQAPGYATIAVYADWDAETGLMVR